MPEILNGTAFNISGKPDNPVIALIHGLGVNRFMWGDYVSALSRQYRVLTYDLYGHGESGPAPETLSLHQFAVQLKELLDELDIERCAVIGFSLGGMINRRFAMDFPDRLSALIILNSPHQRSAEEQRIIEERVSDTSQGGPEATIETSLERWFTARFRSTRLDVVEQVRAWILSNDPICYTRCREILAKGVVELIQPKPPIAQSTLVVTCENDSGSTPSMSYGIAAEISAAQVIILPRLQHLGLMEEPVVFLEPIERFLSNALV